jgi:aspartate aminotransferase-like enzyme
VRRYPAVKLRIPGPTPCPDEVLQAMSKQMINHRGKEFAELIEKETAKLKEFCQTKGDVFVLTGSGTGSMEAAIVNSLSPGDRVLSLSNGVFGERFATIAERFGADVTRINFEWGKPVDPDGARKALQANPQVKAVLVTHNETSTGVTSDLAAIVDAISSLGCVDLQVDNWGCDVVVTGSQKGWMVPPGVALACLSERAWKAHAEAKMPRYYWDFSAARDYLAKGQTPWTPAVSVFYALEVALEMMEREGLQNIFARHARLGQKAREGVKSLGLSLFADEKHASNTVTAVASPDGIDSKKLVGVMRDEHGIVLAGGQASLGGKIFRIGHLGYVTEPEVDEVINELRQALPKVGFKVPA